MKQRSARASRKKRPGNPTFAIRLAPENRAAYDAAAQQQGKETSAWARDILDAAALKALAGRLAPESVSARG